MLAYILAALVSLAWFLVHLLLGGREVAGPLRASNLDPMVRDVSYMCWHFVSWALALSAALFALAAYSGNAAYAVSGMLLSGGFAVVGVGIVPLIGQRYSVVPQGWLFVPVVGLGIWGLAS